jgi:uncharacterized protein (TIGR02145 family)
MGIQHFLQKIFVFLLLIAFAISISTCKKSDNGTSTSVPSVITQTPTAVTDTSASVGGFISTDGGLSIIERGICYGKNQNPTVSDNTIKSGSGIGSYICSITGLVPGTPYYVRAYALNSVGTGYGNQVNFSTAVRQGPFVLTDSVSNITQTGATCSSKVTSEGSSPVTARGVCWSTSHLPVVTGSHTTDGSGSGAFTSSITGLSPGTQYYVRAYATNAVGTSYGSETGFMTQVPATVTDIDGNVYHIITLGTQVWMIENLKTTRFNDGSSIPLVTDPNAWGNLTNAGYCWFNNDEATYKDTYGAMYNFYAATSGNLAPVGWHVPTDADWTVLTDYLGGLAVAGGKMKEAGTSHWMYPNTGADNSSGFTALPGGYRNYIGIFYHLQMDGYYWTSTPASGYGYLRYFYYNSAAVVSRNNGGLTDGFSVRCLKNWVTIYQANPKAANG